MFKAFNYVKIGKNKFEAADKHKAVVRVIIRQVMNMARNILDIEEISPAITDKVRQNLKFKTGNFVWKVQFNIPLDPKTVNKDTMYVVNSLNQRLNVYIRYNKEQEYIEIEPMEAYSINEYYTLMITTDVKSKGGQSLREPVSLKFKL